MWLNTVQVPGMVTSETYFQGPISRGHFQGGSRGARALQFLEQRKQVHFQQTHNQGLRQLFLTVSWDLLAERGTPDGVLDSL